MSAISKIKKSTVDRFLNAWGSAPSASNAPMIIENPCEEIDEALAKGKLGLRVHYAVAGQGTGVKALQSLAENKGDIRGEENHLFSSRRYPNATDNTLGAGAIAQGQYSYFNYAVGQSLSSAGFPASLQATTGETNLFGTPNQISQGIGFQIEREAIIFNAAAKEADIQQILDSGDFQFTTQQNQYTLYKGPMLCWPGGVGVWGASSGQNAETAANGIPDLRAVRSSKIPRMLRPQQQFGYVHNVGQSVRVTDGGAYALSAFTLVRVDLWGVQLTKQQG